MEHDDEGEGGNNSEYGWILSCRDGGGGTQPLCVCLLFVFWGRKGARWQLAGGTVACCLLLVEAFCVGGCC